MSTELITDTLNELSLEGIEKSYRIAEAEDVGRHIVLTKDVEQGEIIFQDRPIVTGPARHSEPVCLSCYRHFHNSPTDPEAPVPYVACPRCKWPMCSEECTNHARHKAECFFLFSTGCRINPGDTDSLYDVIMVLRCLYLKNHKPEAWKELVNLQSCEAASMDEELVDRNGSNNIWIRYIGMKKPKILFLTKLSVTNGICVNIITEKNVRQFSLLKWNSIIGQFIRPVRGAEKVANLICGTFKLAESFSRELVFEMCSRLETNSFEIPWSQQGVAIQGVYSIGCMLEHSCIPSAHKTFNKDLTLNIRAAYSLDEGDAVSLCYTDNLWTTAQRREHLVYSKDFICTCDRCQDNTENETYMSGLKCLKCPDGFYLPDNPLDCATNWFCYKCKAQAPKGYNDMAESKVSEAVSKLEESGLTVPACRKFISTYSRVLHPNHAHMLDVKYSLLNILGHSQEFMMESLTEQDLKEKEDLAICFLNVASKGTSLYELYLSVRQRAILALNQLDKVDHSKESIMGLIRTAGIHLQDCIDCLQYEPEHRPEGRLYKAALMERQNLMELLINVENKFKN